MTFYSKYSFLIFAFIFVFSMTLKVCYCFRSKDLNISLADVRDWSPADATWYGEPNGFGSDGGACGYGSAVKEPPFSSMISAGGPTLYKSGKGCGACYQVRCTSHESCTQKPVTVVITDECPGGPCASHAIHFDLSGTAFGTMATPKNADQLRNLGTLKIEYKKVDCKFPGQTLGFYIDMGANPYYFAILIKYQEGDGQVGLVELMEVTGSKSWVPMQHSHGAVWKLNSGSPLTAPFSLRLTSLESKKVVVKNNVIPKGWKPGQTYRSVVIF